MHNKHNICIHTRNDSHILEVVDPPLGVSFPDLSQGLVLVSPRLQVLPEKRRNKKYIKINQEHYSRVSM